jgi:hypothetical protein
VCVCVCVSLFLSVLAIFCCVFVSLSLSLSVSSSLMSVPFNCVTLPNRHTGREGFGQGVAAKGQDAVRQMWGEIQEPSALVALLLHMPDSIIREVRPFQSHIC